MKTITKILGISLFAFGMSSAGYGNDEKLLSEADVYRFSQAISHVKEYYVDDATDKDLFNNAISGMISGLDPHSQFLNPEDLQSLTESTSGEFAGLGIEIIPENGAIKVVTPLDDTPASRAGLQSGDYIIKIDSQVVQNMTISEAVKAMRGPVSSQVTLKLVRDGSPKPIEVEITREVIKVVSIKKKLLGSGYGYVRISQFQSLTGRDLLSAVNDLRDQSNGNLNGLVLDLRNNPGGLLDAAIEVSDAFLHSDNTYKHEQKIVYTQGRTPSAVMTAQATPGDVLSGAPIVVLINGGSASASEIVAGALQDYGRAIVMGQTSFGKGSVQTIMPLDENHAVKMTTALYYTPAGRKIQAQGIEPDITVENLKVTKGDNETISIKEADLAKHIKNETLALEENKDKVNTADLATEDYQLHEAYALLRALHISKSQVH